MMYIELMEKLAYYTEWSRGCGHTTAMIVGLVNTPNANILIIHQDDWRHIYEETLVRTEGKVRLSRDQFISIDRVPEALMGRSNPIFIDHHTLSRIFQGALREMRELVSQARMQNVQPQTQHNLSPLQGQLLPSPSPRVVGRKFD